MCRKKLLLISPLPEEYIHRLAAHFPHLVIADCTQDRDRVLDEIRDASYVFGRPTREQFLAATRLEFIQVWTQGVESILFPELLASKVIVSNGKGVWSPAIAEHILAMILALYRAIPTYLSFQHEKRWIQKGVTLDRLAGKTVCFVGTGDIAMHTVRLLQGFDCAIIGVNRTGAVPPGFAKVVGREGLLDFLSLADIVCCALPFTPETYHFINDAAFSVMKNTALFINVGRGKTVDENALIRALQEDKIAGAGLDVFEQEPPAPDSPLWTMPNVIITPHIAGMDLEHSSRAFDLLVDNLQRIMENRPVRNQIDKSRGY